MLGVGVGVGDVAAARRVEERVGGVGQREPPRRVRVDPAAKRRAAAEARRAQRGVAPADAPQHRRRRRQRHRRRRAAQVRGERARGRARRELLRAIDVEVRATARVARKLRRRLARRRLGGRPGFVVDLDRLARRRHRRRPGLVVVHPPLLLSLQQEIEAGRRSRCARRRPAGGWQPPAAARGGARRLHSVQDYVAILHQPQIGARRKLARAELDNERVVDDGERGVAAVAPERLGDDGGRGRREEQEQETIADRRPVAAERGRSWRSRRCEAISTNEIAA